MLRCLIFVLVALAGIPAALAEPVFPSGLRIGLEPPGDMTVSKRFNGFEDTGRKAAITILDLPARAYQDIEHSAFAKDQQGLSGIKRESFPFASGIGILISGTAQDHGVTVRRWFLMATAVGGKVQNLAALVSAQVPQAAGAVYSDAVIRKALASVTFRPAPNTERLAMLPFKLDDMAGFRVLQVTPAGDVILIDGPDDDISRQAYMIVSIGPGAPTGQDERARFARNMLDNAPLANLRVSLIDPMRITGAPGLEIRAQATGPRRDSVALVQWVRFSGSGYLRIVGVTAADKWDAAFTRFRAVRDGITFR
jgi:hypothetical protein